MDSSDDEDLAAKPKRKKVFLQPRIKIDPDDVGSPCDTETKPEAKDTKFQILQPRRKMTAIKLEPGEPEEPLVHYKVEFCTPFTYAKTFDKRYGSVYAKERKRQRGWTAWKYLPKTREAETQVSVNDFESVSLILYHTKTLYETALKNSQAKKPKEILPPPPPSPPVVEELVKPVQEAPFLGGNVRTRPTSVSFSIFQSSAI